SSLVHSSPPSVPVVLRDPAELSAAIVQVATKTYEAWAKSATAAQRDELLRGHPSIPRDLDRALLIDLSDVLDEYTLSDPTRVELRSKFWVAAGGS
ncbi:MAG: hypothetical protein RI885_1467, partial [Actinomycetota bacterium]